MPVVRPSAVLPTGTTRPFPLCTFASFGSFRFGSLGRLGIGRLGDLSTTLRITPNELRQLLNANVSGSIGVHSIEKGLDSSV